MRSGELGISRAGENFINAYNLFKNQFDGMNTNAFKYFGTYYLFSIPSIITRNINLYKKEYIRF